jgi:rubrerythrin
MLTGKGFKNVINMAGGIKSWNSNQVVGPEDTGLHLFSDTENLEEVLIVAYSLEKGLQDFYLSMSEQVSDTAVRELFGRLAEIEIKHQERIFSEYRKASMTDQSLEDFEKNLLANSMEGGLTTEQYMELYQPDLEVITEVVSLAMAIEAQALDLYQRTADRAPSEDIQQALLRLADEERAHLKQLGGLLN